MSRQKWTLPNLTGRASAMRRMPSDAERKLWAHLRNRQLADAKFRRQVQIGPYIADFLCHDRKLIVELDGGQHADQATYDRARTQYLKQEDYKVLRFWNNEVLGNLNGVLTMIREALARVEKEVG